MLIDIVVEEGADGIVGRGHSMEVACEMQVDLLHRQYLGIATACSSALNAETRTKRRLAQSDSSFLANLVKAQRQTNTDSSFTDTCLRRTDGGHQN